MENTGGNDPPSNGATLVIGNDQQFTLTILYGAQRTAVSYQLGDRER
jgi:hypothetical protein